jgi:hypothetical protein
MGFQLKLSETSALIQIRSNETFKTYIRWRVILFKKNLRGDKLLLEEWLFLGRNQILESFAVKYR